MKTIFDTKTRRTRPKVSKGMSFYFAFGWYKGFCFYFDKSFGIDIVIPIFSFGIAFFNLPKQVENLIDEINEMDCLLSDVEEKFIDIKERLRNALSKQSE